MLFWLEYFSISIYFKTLENKTSIDPGKIYPENISCSKTCCWEDYFEIICPARVELASLCLKTCLRTTACTLRTLKKLRF
jgi:hypothetical protein